MKIKSYPCQERNGVIWAYMGPRATPPALPELEGNMHGQYYITVLFRNNNWMQGIEGEIDTVHASILHGGHVRPEEARPGSFTYYQSKNRAGRFKVKETPVGNSYGMYRVAEEDSYYWRIGHYLFPCFAMPPVPTLGMEARFLAYVPMDDEHTSSGASVCGRMTASPSPRAKPASTSATAPAGTAAMSSSRIGTTISRSTARPNAR